MMQEYSLQWSLIILLIRGVAHPRGGSSEGDDSIFNFAAELWFFLIDTWEDIPEPECLISCSCDNGASIWAHW